MVQGRTTSKPVTGSRTPKPDWCMCRAKASHVFRSNGRSSAAQIASKVNAGSHRKVSGHTEQCRSLCLELRSLRVVREPMLSPEQHRRLLPCTHEHQKRTIEHGEKEVWSDESCFRVRTYLEKTWHLGGFMGRRWVGGASVTLQAKFCWEILESWLSCGCYFDMQHLPEHCCGPSSPLHGNCILLYHWTLL